MSKVLVIFEKDWADEFSVYGFAVYDKDNWKSLLEDFEKPDVECNGYHFGTNEGWDSKEDIIKGYTKVIDITEDEEKVLDKFFGGGYRKRHIQFGVFPNPGDWL